MAYIWLAIAVLASALAAFFVTSTVSFEHVMRIEGDNPLEKIVLYLVGKVSHLRVVDLLERSQSFGEVARNLLQKDFGRRYLITYRRAVACLFLVCVSVSLICGFVALSFLGVLAGGCICFLMIKLMASKLREQKEKQLIRAMPDVFRTLANSFGSGMTLSQSLKFVGSHQKGSLGTEFFNASLLLDLGEPAESVLQGLERAIQSSTISLLTCSLAIAQKTGSPLRSLFLQTAQLAEEQTVQKQLLVTKTAQVRLSVRIVCLLPAFILLILSCISPEFRSGVMSPTGSLCVGVAVILDVLAILIIKNITAQIEI